MSVNHTGPGIDQEVSECFRVSLVVSRTSHSLGGLRCVRAVEQHGFTVVCSAV
jgi:hypothetical protein